MYRSLSGALYKIVIGVCILVSALLFVLQLRYTSTIYMNAFVTYEEDLLSNILLVGILIICLFLVGIMLGKVSMKCAYIIAIFCAILTLAFDIYFAYYSKNYVVGDQAYVYTAAYSLFNGSRNWIQDAGDYFVTYQNQFFLIRVFAMLFRLLRNTSLFFLQVFLAICNSLSVYYSFVITKNLCNKKEIAAVCPILLTIFVPFHLASLFVYGDVIAVAFLIIGLGIYTSAKDKKKVFSQSVFYVTSYICLALACLIRPIFMIIVVALSIASVLKEERWKKTIALLPFLIIMLYKIASSFCAVKSFEECDMEMRSGVPAVAYVAMGMQWGGNVFDAPGYYNGYNIVVLRNADYDTKIAANTSKDYIKERLSFFKDNPNEAYEFYKEKIAIQWTNPDYDFFYCTSYHDPQLEWIKKAYDAWGGIGTKVFKVLNVIQCCLSFMLTLYFVTLLKDRKDDNNRILLPGLYVIGGFFASVLWETCSRYTYPYAIVSIICCSIAIERVISFVKKSRSRI